MELGWILFPPLQSSHNDQGFEAQAGLEAAQRMQSEKWKRPGCQRWKLRWLQVIISSDRSFVRYIALSQVRHLRRAKNVINKNLGKSDSMETAKGCNMCNCLIIKLGPGRPIWINRKHLCNHEIFIKIVMWAMSTEGQIQKDYRWVMKIYHLLMVSEESLGQKRARLCNQSELTSDTSR